MRINHTLKERLKNELATFKDPAVDMGGRKDTMEPYRKAADLAFRDMANEAGSLTLSEPEKVREVWKSIAQLEETAKTDLLLAFVAKYGFEFDDDIMMCTCNYYDERGRFMYELSIQKKNRNNTI